MLLVLHMEFLLFVEKGCFSWEAALVGLRCGFFNEAVFYLICENDGAYHAFIQIRDFLNFYYKTMAGIVNYLF